MSNPYLPPRWFKRLAWRIHRGIYRLSGGRLGTSAQEGDGNGYAWLTTTGRKSGEKRSVMIGYYRDGADVVTMAMNGWDAPEPQWWLNLLEDPRATVTLPDEELEVVARAAAGDHRARLWARWAEIDRGLDAFAKRRGTPTAVVVLSPVTDDGKT